MCLTKKTALSLLLLILNQQAISKPSNDMLAVIEEDANYLSFYDPANGKNLGGVKLGYLPHEIAISQDQKTAYICNFGIKDYDRNVGREGNSVSVVDIPTRTEKYRLFTFDASEQKDYINIDKAPHGLKLRPPLEKQLYVNIENKSQVLIFDIASRKLIKKFRTEPNTHNFTFSQDGNTLWFMAGSSGIYRMNADTGVITGSLKFNSPIRGLKFTPDYKYVMVSSVNEIDFIDPATLAIARKFDNLGVGQILYSDISPNQQYIVAPAPFDNQVAIIDVKSGNVLRRLITGLNPTTALISRDNKYAYITNATDKNVSKIDLSTFRFKQITTKDSPNNIEFVEMQGQIPHKELLLGVALPLTGADAQKGKDMMRGYEFWRSTVNDAGGLFFQNKSYQVKIIYADTKSDNANVYPLSKELITKDKVKILLSTVGLAGYNMERIASIENDIPLTPAQTNSTPWSPNELAVGEDYFVTSKDFDKQLNAKYGFPASSYTASATSLGISLQKSLLQTDSFEYKKLQAVLDNGRFKNFYSY